MKTLCNYAYVRFVPNPETEEFANVGVVMIKNRPPAFRYLLEKNWTPRLAGFFTDADANSYQAGMRMLEDELDRVARMVDRARQGREPGMADFTEEKFVQFFREMVRPREGRLQFSAPRTLLTENPQQLLQDLFAEIRGNPSQAQALAV